MKYTKNNLHRFLKYLGTILLTAGICIGAYGIFTAPSSDATQLEKELEKNAHDLAMDEDSPVQTPVAVETPVTAKTPTSLQSSSKASEDLPDKKAKKPSVKQQPASPVASPDSTPMETATQAPVSAEETDCPDTDEAISVIGDSVFLGAAPAFKKIYKNAVIDAKISRQVVQGLDIAKSLEQRGKLGKTVIIALGTNGRFNSSTAQKLIDYLGPDRTIYWIDAYGRNLPVQKLVNDTIRKVAKANPNVRVIAWSKEGGKHPDWFYQDGIHLNITGQKKYARFVYKSMKNS